MRQVYQKEVQDLSGQSVSYRQTGQVGKTVTKEKVPKRLSYTALEHSPSMAQVLISVIKVMEKNNLLLDCLGSCFSFYLDHKPASNLHRDF